MTTPQQALAQVPLFSMLPKKYLDNLARQAHDRAFPAGAGGYSEPLPRVTSVGN